MPAHQLLKRGDDKSRAGTLAEFELRDASRDASRPRLLCRSCDSPVTTEADRIAIDGQHVHRRTNPAGIDFEFGCFVAAPGAVNVGEPTAEFSWFAGYTWIYSVCRLCTTHLGWRFESAEGAGPSFHALILARLVREDSERTLH
jgi:hypothetical protein